MCLDICKWGRANDATGEEPLSIAGVKSLTTSHTRAAAHALFQGDTKEAVAVLKKASIAHSELLFVSLALQLMEKNGEERSINGREAVEFDERLASKTDPYLRAISSVIATRDWAAIANQRSLPLRDRVLIAVRHFSDDALTDWLREETQRAIKAGDIEGIVLTGITDPLVDILACFVAKFGDHQTATLLLSVCAPRFIDDVRATAFRSAYRQYLHRHRAFFLRAKFDVESTKRSKLHGRPTLRPMARQITLRCVYCDVQTSLSHGDSHHDRHGSGPAALSGTGAGGGGGGPAVGRGAEPPENPFTVKMVGAGISCPNCKRHLPRCVVCLEVIGMRQQDGQVNGNSGEEASARRFPSFCLKCEHVLHLEHARQWFARHAECPVPECRCKCNVRANPELDYQ